LPLDTADTVRSGADLTLLAWGAMVRECNNCADQLAMDGVDAEVIDVACLNVLDMRTIASSVKKTGRCVIVHEAVGHCGFGAEISARLAEHCILSLRAPILRVTGFDTVMPLPKLEQHYLPDADRILKACRHVMEYR